MRFSKHFADLVENINSDSIQQIKISLFSSYMLLSVEHKMDELHK